MDLDASKSETSRALPSEDAHQLSGSCGGEGNSTQGNYGSMRTTQCDSGGEQDTHRVATKQKLVPNWISSMLRGQFFVPCEKHQHLKKNECTFFCATCAGNEPESHCQHCMHDHAGHQALQIRRYVYCDVVRTVDINSFVDVEGIQAYIINQAKVVFLNARPQAKMGATVEGEACRNCNRNLREGFSYCCLACKVAAIENGLDDSLIPVRHGGAQERTGYSPKTPKMPSPGSGKASRSSGKRARISKSSSREYISWEPQLDDDEDDGSYHEDEPSTSQLKVSRQEVNARHSALFAALDVGGPSVYSMHGTSGKKRMGKADHSCPITCASAGEDVSSCEDGEMSLFRGSSLRDVTLTDPTINNMLIQQPLPAAWAGQDIFSSTWPPPMNPINFEMFKADPMAAMLLWQHQQHQQQLNSFMAAVAMASVAGGMMLPQQQLAPTFSCGGDIACQATVPAAMASMLPPGADDVGMASLMRTGSGSLNRRKQGLPRQSPHL